MTAPLMMLLRRVLGRLLCALGVHEVVAVRARVDVKGRRASIHYVVAHACERRDCGRWWGRAL